jgi:hypothetical protein
MQALYHGGLSFMGEWAPGQGGLWCPGAEIGGAASNPIHIKNRIQLLHTVPITGTFSTTGQRTSSDRGLHKVVLPSVPYK